jgi:hypothetical protein
MRTLYYYLYDTDKGLKVLTCGYRRQLYVKAFHPMAMQAYSRGVSAEGGQRLCRTGAHDAESFNLKS